MMRFLNFNVIGLYFFLMELFLGEEGESIILDLVILFLVGSRNFFYFGNM